MSKIVVIQGPTACGKTTLSISLALKFGAEIISADSRQFYHELNIGTAKPSDTELAQVKHHFVGFESILNPVDVSAFEQVALKTISQLLKAGKLPFLVGGSGLFIDTVTKGINHIPEVDSSIRQELDLRMENEGLAILSDELKQLDIFTYNKIDIHNPRRVIRALEVCIGTGKAFSYYTNQQLPKRDFESVKIGIEVPIEVLYKRIEDRCDQMFDNGLVNEVESLIEFRELTSLKTIGYTEFFDYFDHKYSLDEAIAKFKQHSRNYAKRQMTWLRRDKEIVWFQANEIQKMEEFIRSSLN